MKEYFVGAAPRPIGRSRLARVRFAPPMIGHFVSKAPWVSVSCLIATCVCGPAFAEAPRTSGSARTDPYEVLSQIGHALQVVEHQYYTPPNQDQLEDGAIRGMLAGLDPHSTYFNRQDLELFEGSTSGKFGGIGVEVEFSDGEIIVIAPIEGSPADRAGVRSGDEIVAINGRPLFEMPSHEVVRLMRGKIGSKLKLTIRAAKTRQLREVGLVREQIAVASVRPQFMKGGVGYFRIKAFQEGTHREFIQALGLMRRERGSLQGLILDLRNNPGGLVREAAALADEFLTHGVLFSTRHRGQVVRIEEARRGGAYSQGPLVVLVNEFSASAAELVAGALKDHRRGQLYGAQTFGKGSVQTLLHLTRGGALKLTTALYYTPSGKTTQALGITPHHIIDPGYETGSVLGVLREKDLKGHLEDPTKKEKGAATPPRKPHGTPPTNNELHLGVARVVDEDPSKSADLTLRAAYRAILGLPPNDQQRAPSSTVSPQN